MNLDTPADWPTPEMLLRWVLPSPPSLPRVPATCPAFSVYPGRLHEFDPYTQVCVNCGETRAAMEDRP